MNLETVSPFLLIVAPFFVAFLLEAFVIYFFRLKRFWASAGIAFLINLLSLGVLYGSSLLVGKLGYEFNGLQLPLQVVLFLWWLSIVADGILLRFFAKNTERKRIYLCSIVMNTLSYFFLYFFITNSH
jgi:hypothetical protein